MKRGGQPPLARLWAELGDSDTASAESDPQKVAEEGVSGTPSSVPHRAEMEQRFGTSFERVEAYTGAEADAACDELGAEAYAQGDKVAFKSKAPDKPTVAHELTHVVQQTGAVRGKGMTSPGDREEREASAVESAVRSGAPLPEIGAAEPAVAGNFKELVEQRREAVREREQAREDRRGQLEEGMMRAAEGGRDRDWNSQLGDLERNFKATYEAIEMGFKAQSAAFTEAWKQVEEVLNAVSERRQAIATVIGVFMTFAAGFAGKAVEGMLKGVVGRLGGSVSGGAQDAIVGGITAVMGKTIEAAPNAIEFDAEMPTGDGFSDPDSFHRNGVALIAKEKYKATNFTTWMGNNRDALEEADEPTSPADVLERLAGRLAKLRMAGEEAQSRVDAERLERALWESWVGENGQKVVQGYLSTTTTFDVPKEVLERLDELGVPESRVRQWAGVD